MIFFTRFIIFLHFVEFIFSNYVLNRENQFHENFWRENFWPSVSVIWLICHDGNYPSLHTAKMGYSGWKKYFLSSPTFLYWIVFVWVLKLSFCMEVEFLTQKSDWRKALFSLQWAPGWKIYFIYINLKILEWHNKLNTLEKRNKLSYVRAISIWKQGSAFYSIYVQ